MQQATFGQFKKIVSHVCRYLGSVSRQGQLISLGVHLLTAFCRETRRLSGVASVLFRLSRTLEGDEGAVDVVFVHFSPIVFDFRSWQADFGRDENALGVLRIRTREHEELAELDSDWFEEFESVEVWRRPISRAWRNLKLLLEKFQTTKIIIQNEILTYII